MNLQEITQTDMIYSHFQKNIYVVATSIIIRLLKTKTMSTDLERNYIKMYI